jgi:hypothetical protein
MNSFSLEEFFEKYKLIAVVLIIASFSVIFGLMVTQLDGIKAILITGGIVFLAISIFSLINYRFGFYAALTMGFFIFTIARLSTVDLPVGPLVEIPLYCSFLGLFLNRIINQTTIFQKSGHIITYGMFIYVLFHLVQILNPDMDSISGWALLYRRFFMIGVLYFIALNIFDSVRSVIFFFSYWVFWSFIAGFYSVWQSIFGLSSFEERWLRSSAKSLELFYISDGVYRKWSLFAEPASFGIAMAATSILMLVLMILVKNTRIKIVFSLLIVFIFLGVAYSGTRTAYFIIVVGICLYILMTITQKRTLIFASSFFVLFLMIMFAPIYSNVTINRIRTTFAFSEDASLNVRDINRNMIQPYIYKHPFGGGMGTSGGAGLMHNPSHFLAGFPPDSGYVKTAIETGWIGLFLQCLLYFFILQSGLKAYLTCRNKIFRPYLIAAVVCVFSFVIAQYGQEATDQVPECFLFFSCLAVIAKAQIIDQPLERLL